MRRPTLRILAAPLLAVPFLATLAAAPAVHAADEHVVQTSEGYPSANRPDGGPVEHYGEEHGEGYDSHDDPSVLSLNVQEALWNLAIFLLLLGLLGKFVWPVIRDGLKAREHKLRSDLAAAEKQRADADRMIADHEARLAEARKEAQAIVAESRTAAQKAGAAERQKAEAELASLKQSATRDIASAKEQALSEIYAQAAEMSTAIAGKILHREITPADQQQLIDQSLEQFKAKSANN